MTRKDGWDCIFVGRIDANKRIYLTSPQEFGYMYISGDNIPAGNIKKSMKGECGNAKEDSLENRKIFDATSIAIAYNQDSIANSNGLVVRGSERGEPVVFHRRDETIGEKSAWLGQKRIAETTEWLVYISPSLGLYHIDGYRKGEEFKKEDKEKIANCTRHILDELEIRKERIINGSTQKNLFALEKHPEVMQYLLDNIDKSIDGKILVKVKDIESGLGLDKYDMVSMSLDPNFWRLGLQAALSKYWISSIAKIYKNIDPETGKNYILLELTRSKEIK